MNQNSIYQKEIIKIAFNMKIFKSNLECFIWKNRPKIWKTYVKKPLYGKYSKILI